MIKLNTQQKNFLKKSGVVLAYVYGSYARGKTNKLSDIDIAVLLDDKIKSQKYSAINIKLNNFFIDFFKRDDVFVVILNNATPVLKYEVIQDGKLFYALNKTVETDFIIQATHEYEDTRLLRLINSFYLKERARLDCLAEKVPSKYFFNKVKAFKYESN